MKETTKLICVAVVAYLIGGVIQADYYQRRDKDILRSEYLQGVMDGVEEILKRNENAK